MGFVTYKVVYTVSDTTDLISRVLKSIKSLEKFVPKENIIVFYTPPRSVRNYQILSNAATVIDTENITKPFDAEMVGKRRYGEKVHLCEVDCPSIIFLDADTVVKKDITQLLDGNFDFSARASPYYFTTLGNPKQNNKLNQSAWKRMFEVIGKQPLAMFNAGFLIFKNYCHKRIYNYWLQYINNEFLPNPSPPSNCREQWALSLALASIDVKIKYMTFEQHAYVLGREQHMETYVLHGRLPPRCTRFRNWLGNQRRRVQKLLIEVIQ